ncbi:MAG TPA: NlpC/P60 family protein [Gaiellaceae bacterium]|nr:NlpC/P60 family protein [Gaiellaceae bacterium]
MPYLLFGILAALSGAVPAFATPPGSISAKQSEARQIYAQVQQLNANLAKADEQVNFANYKLASVQHEIKVNRRELKVAQLNLKKSQKMIAERLVSLYTTPPSSTLEVILGAKSLDQILTSVDSEHRVSSVDTQVIDQVQTFKSAVKRRGQWLASANMQARQLLAQRQRVLASVTRQRDERTHLLSEIQGQIATLQAEQIAAEQAAARQARANLAEAEGQVLSSATVIGATGQVPGSNPVLPASSYSGVVGVAMRYLGTPYVWAGAAPGGFDCSGLVMYSYAQVGVSLPHSSYAMWDYGVAVSKDQLEPGDIVFFDGLGHVGLYVGGGDFIQAPQTGDVVKISSLNDGYYASNYVGARRIL